MLSGMAEAWIIAAQEDLVVHERRRRAAALAGPTHTHALSLHRVMRALAGLGVLSEDDNHRFALTPLESPFDRITQNPTSSRDGATIRGLRISVAHMVNLVANGMTSTEIVTELPDLEEEDVRQALAYTAALPVLFPRHLAPQRQDRSSVGLCRRRTRRVRPPRVRWPSSNGCLAVASPSLVEFSEATREKAQGVSRCWCGTSCACECRTQCAVQRSGAARPKKHVDSHPEQGQTVVQWKLT